jgi:hypothetical protein
MQIVAMRETRTARDVQGRDQGGPREPERQAQKSARPSTTQSPRAKERSTRGAGPPRGASLASAPRRSSQAPPPPGPTWLRPRPPARPLRPSPGRRRTLLKAKSSCLSFSRCGSAPCRRNRNFIILRPGAGAAPAAAAARRMRRAAPPVLKRGRGARRPGRGHAGRSLPGGGSGARRMRRPTNEIRAPPCFPLLPCPPDNGGVQGPRARPGSRRDARCACAAAWDLPGLVVCEPELQRGSLGNCSEESSACFPGWRTFFLFPPIRRHEHSCNKIALS